MRYVNNVNNKVMEYHLKKNSLTIYVPLCWVKKVKGLRSTNWWLQNSHEDIKCSIGNIVNNIVIAMYGARWVLELSG